MLFQIVEIFCPWNFFSDGNKYLFFSQRNITNSFEAYLVRIVKIISLLMEGGSKSILCWKKQYDHLKQYHAALKIENILTLDTNIRKKLFWLYK
jgi:hypothetical protein